MALGSPRARPHRREFVRSARSESEKARHSSPTLEGRAALSRPAGYTDVPAGVAPEAPPLPRQLVEILDERHHRAVEPLHFRIRGLDHVVLVRRVGPAPVAEAEVARGELERLPREDVTRVRASVPRP